MSAIGFLPYLGFIFLPGLGIGELLQIWRAQDGFTARLAYAFGLGLSADAVVLIVRTAGVTGLLTGIDPYTIYATALVGLGMLVVSVLRSRLLYWWKTPTRLDYAFLAVLFFQAAIIVLYFQKYTLFPNFVSQDFIIHVRNTVGLIAGTNSTIPRGILYDGVYYQLGPALVLVGGLALTTIRWTMAILVIIAPLLVYLVGLRLTGSQRGGVVAALVYVISGPIWFGMVFVSGLYSNFFGILAALFLLVVFLDTAFGPITRATIFTLGITTVMVYFSHFSVVTILPVILAYPIILLLFTRKIDRRAFISAAIVILPGLAGLAVYPHILHRLFLANIEVASITGSTTLSSLLSGYPFLEYLALAIYSDLDFIILISLALVFVWKLWSSKAPILTIPILWFGVILAVAPSDVSAWRYSLEALLPLTLMAGIGLFALLPKSKAGRGRQDPKGTRWKIALILLLVLTPIFAESWSARALDDSITDTSLAAHDQSLVNQSIIWLGSNTPTNSKYLSISDVNFLYTKYLIDRVTLYEFASYPSAATQIAGQLNASYVIVTEYVNGNVPENPSLYPWNNFPVNGTSSLILVYQNDVVRIYLVT